MLFEILQQGEMLVFKVNDYVMYGSTGVCQITAIEKDTHINRDETEYYILRPIYNNTMNNMIIKTPVHNQKVLMRAVISKDDVSSLIAMMSEKETIWINDYRQRIEFYKILLKTGKCEDLVKLIRTLYLEKKERSAVGNKLSLTDEYIMNTAEKLLYGEFAIALNILPDDVVPYILKRVS